MPYFLNLGAALRKIVAILMLALLLFNWVGYRLLSDYLQHRASVQFETKLDKNEYQEDELIQIKIPLHLPYQLNWKSFERFDGEIDVDGVHYKYVKRKVFNDSLVLLCLPNKSKQNLQKAEDDYFQTVSDIDPASQKKSDNNNRPLKNILSEFFVEQPIGLTNSTLYRKPAAFVAREFNFLSAAPQDTPGQPPEC